MHFDFSKYNEFVYLFVVIVFIAGIIYLCKWIKKNTKPLEAKEKHQPLSLIQESIQPMGLPHLFSLIYERGEDAILLTDIQNNIIAANHAVTKMSGYEKEELLGRNPRIFSSGKHSYAFYKEIWRTLLVGQDWHGEVINRHKNGDEYKRNVLLYSLKNDLDEISYFVSVYRLYSFSDHCKIENSTGYDTLTGLPNRILMQDRIRQLQCISRRNHRYFSVLFIDIDRFMQINNLAGRLVGDKLLQAVAKRLVPLVRSIDSVCRYSGDEFVILLDDADSNGASIVAQKIISAFSDDFYINKARFNLTVSIGIAISPVDGETGEILLSSADIAMYQAKKAGGNKYWLYNRDVKTYSRTLFALEKDIYSGLNNDEFYLEFQPKYDIHLDKITGAEALLRWKHPYHDHMPPDEFLPAAESTGQIIDLGDIVIRKTLSALHQLRSQGYLITLSFNVTMAQIESPLFIQKLEREINHAQVKAEWIDIELTENAILDESNPYIKTVLARLHELGISISIDDFGAGYSGLSYLKKIKAKYLKIDRSFISCIESSDNDMAIIKSIVFLAKQFNMEVIAEGVETEFQYNLIKVLGCDIVQGYLTGRPMSLENLISLLQQKSSNTEN